MTYPGGLTWFDLDRKPKRKAKVPAAPVTTFIGSKKKPKGKPKPTKK